MAWIRFRVTEMRLLDSKRYFLRSLGKAHLSNGKWSPNENLEVTTVRIFVHYAHLKKETPFLTPLTEVSNNIHY